MIKPIIGAIRWDAWHGHMGMPGMAVQKSLGPKKWHYRIPFFGKIISDSEVIIDGTSQEIMDQEIDYAKKAGFDYWAFVAYESDNPMSLGLKNYLSSSRREEVNFCLIFEASKFGNYENYIKKINRIIQLMEEDSYQKVLGGRPLIYISVIMDNSFEKIWGNLNEFRKCFEELRKSAKLTGIDNPYIVIMDFNPERGGILAKALGADAISSYATSPEMENASYIQLTKHVEGFWDKCKSTGCDVVPVVMSGWDRRPRVENPVPWEKGQIQGERIEKYFKSPTPAELADHLESSMSWIKVNPDVARSKAVIIYAWNENDEGGWLVPTLSEGTARIDAIGKVLK